MSISEQLLTLINRLRPLTDEGDVRWEQAGPTSFRLGLERGSISITSRDGDGDYPFTISIRNGEGVVVEEVELFPVDEGAAPVKSLYLAASRNATGANEVIADMLRELPDPDIPF